MRRHLAIACLALLTLAAGCGDDAGHDATPPSDPPFQELYDQGVDRYLGAFTPTASQPLGGGVINHAFAEREGGPVCFTGSPFSMSTRDGSGDALMIFLQGGGGCAPDACDAVDQAPPLLPTLGILDPDVPGNPAADFDVGYVPYCDGTLFAGDRDVDSDGDGAMDRRFRGVQNLSAALDVIADTYPAPSRILLIGNSAGGFGVHFALPLVRALYPDVRVDLVNDSGVGIMGPGAPERLIAYWGAEAVIPASCTDCISDEGTLTGYHDYQLRQDPDLRVGFLSTKRDEVIVASNSIDGPTFEAALLNAVDVLNEAHGDRFESLVADGDGHTFVLRDFERPIADTIVIQWITDMITDADAWASASD